MKINYETIRRNIAMHNLFKSIGREVLGFVYEEDFTITLTQDKDEYVLEEFWGGMANSVILRTADKELAYAKYNEYKNEKGGA